MTHWLHVTCQIKILTGYADKFCFVVGRIYQLPDKAVMLGIDSEIITGLVTDNGM